MKDITLTQLVNLCSALGQGQCDQLKPDPTTANQFDPIGAYTVGKIYFIRTVTHHYIGRLRSVGPHELILVDAAWIPDDGRFTQAMETGDFNEVEMYPPGRQVIIGRAAILDACEHTKLPASQK